MTRKTERAYQCYECQMHHSSIEEAQDCCLPIEGTACVECKTFFDPEEDDDQNDPCDCPEE